MCVCLLDLCSLRIVEGGAHALFEKPMRTAAQAALADLLARQDAGRGARTSSEMTAAPGRQKRARAD